MRISTLSRHFREGVKSIIRNGWMTFASVSSISISLFILGLFVILSLNVNFISQQIENQVTIRVYLEQGTSAETRNSLQKDIQSIADVEKVTFVSKDEGLNMLKEQLGDSLDGLEGENNPLNDSFTVEMKDPRTVENAANQISSMNEGKTPKPIVKVDYGKDTVDTLFKMTTVVRYVGLIFVVCLVFTSMFLISNTIKLTILARNREIRIMKMVGATNGFIRWPFFIEGALIGFCGAIIPVVLLLYGYWMLFKSISMNLNMLGIHLKPYSEISLPLGGLLMGIGLVIGIWGSTISVRKFLKV